MNKLCIFELIICICFGFSNSFNFTEKWRNIFHREGVYPQSLTGWGCATVASTQAPRQHQAQWQFDLVKRRAQRHGVTSAAGRRQNPRWRRRSRARRSAAFAATEPTRRGLLHGQGPASRGGRKLHRRRGSAAAERRRRRYGVLEEEGGDGDVPEGRILTLDA